MFLVDISGSMQGSAIENVKTAILAALPKLNPVDTFNVIAFNGSSLLFSPSLVPASKEMIGKASEWIGVNFIAEGGTNISAPLNQVFGLCTSQMMDYDLSSQLIKATEISMIFLC